MDEMQIPGAVNGAETKPAASRICDAREEGVEQQFLDHFGLSEQPFGVTPDPRFLYLGSKHRQALAALHYGTEMNRGFLTLIAPPGLGKTSLLFNYLEGLRDTARIVYLFQTDCDARDLMAYVLADLGLEASGKDLPQMHSMLNRVLEEQMRLGRRFILVIDEAQNLSEKVLESVRLLSNFETPWAKLMQIVLAGQPQLAERLAEPSMSQLRQRISFSVELESLSSEEASAYIDHRLWIAGYNGSPLFSVGARNLIAEYSEGVPRRINNLCFCAMSLAWATKKETIDRELMREVLAEMNLAPRDAKTPKVDSETNPLDLPKPSFVAPVRQPAVLTVKEAPANNWMPKIAVAAAVLAAMGWFGVRFEAGKRLMNYWGGVSATEKLSAAPARESLSVSPAAPAASGDFSSAPSSDVSGEDAPRTSPQFGGAKSAPPSQQPE